MLHHIRTIWLGLLCMLVAALTASDLAQAREFGRGGGGGRVSSARSFSAPRAAPQRSFVAPRAVSSYRSAPQRSAPQRFSAPSRPTVARSERSAPRYVQREQTRPAERKAFTSNVTRPARTSTERVTGTAKSASGTGSQSTRSVESRRSGETRFGSEPPKSTGPAVAATQPSRPLPGRMSLTPGGIKAGTAAAIAAGGAAGYAAGAALSKPPASLPAGVKVGNGLGLRPAGVAPTRFAAGPRRPGWVPGLLGGSPRALAFAPRYPLIKGHRFAGLRRLPLFFVAGLYGFGPDYWYYRSSGTYLLDDPLWVLPAPSCYVAGEIFYRDPGRDDCFDFLSAAPGDPFESGGRVYSWQPDSTSSVEDLIADEDANGRSVPLADWKRANPSSANAAAARPKTVAAPTPLPTLALVDCSACLAAQGPIEAGNGMCSLTIANSCPQPISFKGGVSRAPGGTAEEARLTCEFSTDIDTGAQTSVCTAPCASFDQAHTFITAATPKAGAKLTPKACRLIDPAKVDAARKSRLGSSSPDIYAPEPQ